MQLLVAVSGVTTCPWRQYRMRFSDTVAHFPALDAFVDSETPSSIVPVGRPSRRFSEFLREGPHEFRIK
jgi:hypothetical protein